MYISKLEILILPFICEISVTEWRARADDVGGAHAVASGNPLDVFQANWKKRSVARRKNIKDKRAVAATVPRGMACTAPPKETRCVALVLRDGNGASQAYFQV